MIFSTKPLCQGTHRRACLQSTFIWYRMRTGKTFQPRNFGMIFIIRDNHARAISQQISTLPRRQRHRSRRLANRNHCCGRRWHIAYSACGNLRRMASRKGRIKRTACDLTPSIRCFWRGIRHATGSISACPAAKARAFSTTFIPIAVRVSIVADPRCGNNTVFGAERRAGLICGSP